MDLLGSTLNQRFRLDQEIGRGGFGVVYRALDLQLGREVAVKILFSQLASTDSVQRFLREAQVSSQLQDPHIITTFDFGVYEGGIIYIVTELLRGLALSALHNKTALSLGQICNLMAQISQGLLTAHQAGVIHRDIKPANLFVEWRNKPIVKVIDFGIAKALQTSQESSNDPDSGVQTQTKALFGTPHYMSPEQVRSTKNVSFGSDVYSLGVVLFELIMGHLPFESEEPIQIMIKHLQEPLPELSAEPIERHHSTPTELWQRVMTLMKRMMDKDEDQRLIDCQVITDEFIDLYHELKKSNPTDHATELQQIKSLIDDRAISYSKTQSGLSLPRLNTASGSILSTFNTHSKSESSAQSPALGDTLDSAESLRSPELEKAHQSTSVSEGSNVDATVDWDKSTAQPLAHVKPQSSQDQPAPQSSQDQPAPQISQVPYSDATLGSINPLTPKLADTHVSISMSREPITPLPNDKIGSSSVMASDLQADFSPKQGFSIPQEVPKSTPYPTLFPEGFGHGTKIQHTLPNATQAAKSQRSIGLTISAGLIGFIGLWLIVGIDFQDSSSPQLVEKKITKPADTKPADTKPVKPTPSKVRIYFKSQPSFTIGENIRISAKVWDKSGKRLQSKVTYKVYPSKIARVKRGKLYFKKQGEAKIKACVKTKGKSICSPKKTLYVIDPF